MVGDVALSEGCNSAVGVEAVEGDGEFVADGAEDAVVDNVAACDERHCEFCSLRYRRDCEWALGVYFQQFFESFIGFREGAATYSETQQAWGGPAAACFRFVHSAQPSQIN